MELACGLAALAWHITPEQFDAMPHDEQVRLLAILRVKSDMEFVDSHAK